MKKDKKIKLIAAVGALALAGGYWIFAGGTVLGVGGRTAYFYDLSEKKLYEAPFRAFAPIEGIGGESGDGVEAVVVCCPICGESKKRIAFLRTHTAEYKQKREQAREAGERIPGLSRQWISDNTLVRLVDGDKWYKTSSKEGVGIVSGWKRRCPEHGKWEKPFQPH